MWGLPPFPASAPLCVSTLPAQLLEQSEAGCRPFLSAFLAVSVFLVLLGDLLLSLQTPLRFPLVDQASPDLCRENEELWSVDRVKQRLATPLQSPKDLLLREWLSRQPEPGGVWLSCFRSFVMSVPWVLLQSVAGISWRNSQTRQRKSLPCSL